MGPAESPFSTKTARHSLILWLERSAFGAWTRIPLRRACAHVKVATGQPFASQSKGEWPLNWGAAIVNVFELDEALLRDYERFARSFTQIRAPDIRVQVEEIYASDRFWPEPLVSINPRFERGASIDQLAGSGTLHEGTALRVPAFPLSRCPTRNDIDTKDHSDVTSGLVPSFLRAV
jgi:hypothetical protein